MSEERGTALLPSALKLLRSVLTSCLRAVSFLPAKTLRSSEGPVASPSSVWTAAPLHQLHSQTLSLIHLRSFQLDTPTPDEPAIMTSRGSPTQLEELASFSSCEVGAKSPCSSLP